MADRAKHAFGALERIDDALSSGSINAYDILFVKDANGKPYVGWIDKDGNKVICEDKAQIVRVEELPVENGDENVVYIYNNEGYIWDGEKCVPMAKSADVTTLETQVNELTTQMEQKVDATTVQSMIENHYESAYEIIEF